MNSDRHPNETAERAGFQEHYSVSHARGRIVFLVPSTPAVSAESTKDSLRRLPEPIRGRRCGAEVTA
jgi:hypothetical protein